MIVDLLKLWGSAVPLMLSPGPAVLSVAAMGAAFVPARALRYYFGIVAGTFSVLLIVASGLTAALLSVPGLAPVITVLAAGYILYLAYRIATAPILKGGAEGDTADAPSFLSGYLLAVANPKAFAALGALYAGHSLVPGDPYGDAAAKVGGLACMIFIANGSWLIFGTMLSKVLRDPKAGRVANIVFAVLLVLSVAISALDR